MGKDCQQAPCWRAGAVKSALYRLAQGTLPLDHWRVIRGPTADHFHALIIITEPTRDPLFAYSRNRKFKIILLIRNYQALLCLAFSAVAG